MEEENKTESHLDLYTRIGHNHLMGSHGSVHERVGLVHNIGLSDLAERMLREAAPVYLVRPEPPLLADLVSGLYEKGSSLARAETSIRIIGEDFDTVTEVFAVKHKLAELQRTGILEIRRCQSISVPVPLILSADVAHTIVPMEDHRLIYSADHPDDFEVSYSYTQDLWSKSAAIEIDGIVNWSVVTRSLEKMISSDLKEEFLTLLEIQHEKRPEYHIRPEPVRLLLLAAARTETTQASLTEWGEKHDIVSKSTLSRHKRWLIRHDIIDNERTSTGDGRTEMTLYIDDPKLKGLNSEEFFELVGRAIRSIDKPVA